MKHPLSPLSVLLVLLLLCIGTPVTAADPPITLKVLVLNINHGAAWREQPRLGRLVALLAEYQPDLVALNEIQRYHPKSGLADQIEYITRETGLAAVYGLNANMWPSGHGNLLLSRYPIVDVRRHYLPGDGEQRGLLEAGLNVRGHRLTVLLTHLAPAEAARALQVEFLIERLAAVSGPRLLLGDLNAPPGEAPIARLISAVGSHVPAPTATYPAAAPTVRADYILPDDSLILQSETVLPTAISDHLPVLGVLRLSPLAPFSYDPNSAGPTVDLTQLPGVPESARLITSPGLVAGVSAVSATGSPTPWEWQPELGLVRTLATGDLRDLYSYHRELGRYYLSAEVLGVWRPRDSTTSLSAGVSYSTALSTGWARRASLALLLPGLPGGTPSTALSLDLTVQAPLGARAALRAGMAFSRTSAVHLGLVVARDARSTWEAALSRGADGALRATLSRSF